ncbi:UDP-N-acetylglucosamine 2-epimerase [Candidatus Gracilibacteria bacterium]|nr:UDP-N-acetylglucosamine 2-epimerase [Candidatus Gracilibacteria bacterium]
MIHLVIGTKAQLIKMVGIIKELDANNIPYNYIDTGQHSTLTKEIRHQFSIREPDYKFVKDTTNITSNKEGIPWMIGIFFKSIWNRKKIFQNDKKGLCLVHGDTVSTILGAIMGRISGQKVVHVEAGLRTPHLFKPFPEEMIRRITDKMSYINFALTNDSYNNLSKINAKNENMRENTLIDAVKIAQASNASAELPEKFILVSIHRYESIHSKSRMEFIVNSVLDLAKNNKIVWGLHEPTKNSLIKYNLFKQIEANPNITLRGLFPYFDFINAISRSKFLITDGGGPQDETRYLNIPCLLMRTENERPEHTHIYQSEFKKENVDHFINNIHSFQALPTEATQPSKEIVKIPIKELAH